MEEHLQSMYVLAWKEASQEERQALLAAAGEELGVNPIETFTVIAARARSFDPALFPLLWDELEIQQKITRIELGGISLSPLTSQALQMALAYELGTRIDRALAELSYEEITEEKLREKARGIGVPWQALSYAIGRELEG
jgi:hypothetical protein